MHRLEGPKLERLTTRDVDSLWQNSLIVSHNVGFKVLSWENTCPKRLGSDRQNIQLTGYKCVQKDGISLLVISLSSFCSPFWIANSSGSLCADFFRLVTMLRKQAHSP